MLLISSSDALTPYTSKRCASISRVVMPREYTDRIMSSMLPSRRACLGTIRGSNVPLRSRGTATLTGSFVVDTVFVVLPLRELPTPARRGRPPRNQMPGHLGSSARSTTASVIWLRSPSTPSSGVADEFALGGVYSSERVLLRLMQEIRRVARRTSGIRHVELAYSRSRPRELDAADLQRGPRRCVLGGIGRRLGGRALLHRLRAPARGRDNDHLRGQACRHACTNCWAIWKPARCAPACSGWYVF